MVDQFQGAMVIRRERETEREEENPWGQCHLMMVTMMMKIYLTPTPQKGCDSSLI